MMNSVGGDPAGTCSSAEWRSGPAQSFAQSTVATADHASSVGQVQPQSVLSGLSHAGYNRQHGGPQTGLHPIASLGATGRTALGSQISPGTTLGPPSASGVRTASNLHI